MTEKIRFVLRPNAEADRRDVRIDLKTTEPHKKEIKERAEELGFNNLSEAVRYFITIGMHAFEETDPRNSSYDDVSEYNPLTIRDVIPEGRENALNMREKEVMDAIDEMLAKEISADPEIQQEGWEVWRE